MFGAIARIGSALIRPIVRNPVVKEVVKSTAIGTAMYAAGNALTGGGGSSSSLPALPNLQGGPVMPGGMLPQMGERGWFRNDPNIPDFLKPFAISKGNLKAYYRGPKGTVIVYDSVGDPYALDRKLAIRFKLWKPGHKPPISVGDWQAVKRADRTVKKMKKIFRMTTRVDKDITGGKVVVTKGRKRK
jgi:hypothetical protein